MRPNPVARKSGRASQGLAVTGAVVSTDGPHQTQATESLSAGNHTTSATAEQPPTVMAGLRFVLTLLANVAVLTALLIYFGWRRTETQSAAMGFDESILGMGTQDYVLRSVGPVLRLLAIVAAGGFLAVRFHVWASRRASQTREHDAWFVVLTVLMLWSWLLLPGAVVLAGLWVPEPAYVGFPLSIGLGGLLLPYSDALRARKGWRSLPKTARLAEQLLSLLIVLIALFWATSNYADVLGNQIAQRIADGTSASTGVAVYSPTRLHLGGAGIIEEQAPAGGYRYSGLRLLEHTSQGYVLLSTAWTPDSGVVIVLPESASLRFEFGPGTR